MLQDCQKYPFLQVVIDNYTVIQKEFLEARLVLPEIGEIFEDQFKTPSTTQDFKEWIRGEGIAPTQLGYDTRGDKPVVGIPVYTAKKKELFPDHFPGTYKILKSVKGLKVASFMIMSPHSHILAHKHIGTPNVFVFHINLFNLDGFATFRVNDDVLKYSKEKDFFLFQPVNEHESVNDSETYRVTFLVQFEKKSGLLDYIPDWRSFFKH